MSFILPHPLKFYLADKALLMFYIDTRISYLKVNGKEINSLEELLEEFVLSTSHVPFIPFEIKTPLLTIQGSFTEIFIEWGESKND